PEWNFVDMGIQQIGAVSVPLYPTITIEDYKFILEDSNSKIVFVSDQELYEKVIEAIKDFADKPKVFSFERVTGIQQWTEILPEDISSQEAEIEKRKSEITPEDLLTIIYTSGTTGLPKGVMLTHNNLVSNFKSCFPLMPVDNKSRALSFLPLCHVYERMLSYLYQFTGLAIYYAESLETIGDNLKEVKPHIFVTVPRLLEKVYDKIVAKGSELTGIKKSLFFWALGLGHSFEIDRNQGFFYNIQLKLANKIIFSKWREALGGNVQAVVSGGAALQPRLARIFWSANIRIMEGYGLTETSPVIAVNRVDPKENRIGTVGPVIPGVEVKIAEDGEILTKGPHIMKGYYKRDDLTKEVINSDGFFHTGDIGEFREGKFLKITDRKKEMFKTSGGKYIAPQLIENKIKESKVIEQVMVVGDGKKFASALLVPAFDGLRDWCKIKGIEYTTDQEMIQKDEIITKFQKEIDNANENFAKWETIKKFHICTDLWTIEGGELTAKLSLKRREIMKKFDQQVEGFYAD
ncbi:MAG: AMP-binding protein, partial [Nitrosopumilus sp.]|nr:AMP-binding protein [Nitrosopumilus sp.]